MTVAVPAIRPISDLRTDLNTVCNDAAMLQEPIFMTKNGKPSLVVMDCEAYERERQHERYVLKLREAEIEARYKKEAISFQQADKRIQALLSELNSDAIAA